MAVKFTGVNETVTKLALIQPPSVIGENTVFKTVVSVTIFYIYGYFDILCLCLFLGNHVLFA